MSQAGGPDDETFIAVLVDELRDETDRGCVLIGAAILDDALEEALRAKFKSLSPITDKEVTSLIDDRSQKPLGTFSARILTAYAIGLIDQPAFNAFEAIRAIRNKAAHLSAPLRFGHYTSQWSALLSAVDPRVRDWFKYAAAETKGGTSPLRGEFIRTVLWLWIGLRGAVENPTEGIAVMRQMERIVGAEWARRQKDS